MNDMFKKTIENKEEDFSRMSLLEVFIERELSERNLPESDDFGWSD